jgi:hypothetical protein
VDKSRAGRRNQDLTDPKTEHFKNSNRQETPSEQLQQAIKCRAQELTIAAKMTHINVYYTAQHAYAV